MSPLPPSPSQLVERSWNCAAEICCCRGQSGLKDFHPSGSFSVFTPRPQVPSATPSQGPTTAGLWVRPIAHLVSWLLLLSTPRLTHTCHIELFAAMFCSPSTSLCHAVPSIWKIFFSLADPFLNQPLSVLQDPAWRSLHSSETFTDGSL